MEPDLECLPHWSRVAFAAKCARRVQPLFAESWPEAASAVVSAVELAITLAERSAAARRACDGLQAAHIGATCAAGRALIPHHYPIPIKSDNDDPGVADPDKSLIASFSAKVAEFAAKAAEAAPGKSAYEAEEALRFALHAIRVAEKPGLAEVLEADFEFAVESTRRGQWWRFW